MTTFVIAGGFCVAVLGVEVADVEVQAGRRRGRGRLERDGELGARGRRRMRGGGARRSAAASSGNQSRSVHCTVQRTTMTTQLSKVNREAVARRGARHARRGGHRRPLHAAAGRAPRRRDDDPLRLRAQQGGAARRGRRRRRRASSRFTPPERRRCASGCARSSHAVREVFERHPALPQLRARGPIVQPPMFRMTEPAMRMLLDAGFPPEEAARTFRCSSSTSSARCSSAPTRRQPRTSARARAALHLLPEDEFPAIAATAEHMAASHRRPRAVRLRRSS